MDGELREFYDENSSALFAFVYAQTLSLKLTDQRLELIWERVREHRRRAGPPRRVCLYVLARQALMDGAEATNGHGHEGNGKSQEPTRVDESLARLPVKHRELVSLKFDAELSYEEIAEVLGISESEVGLMMLQALRKLRVLLAKP